VDLLGFFGSGRLFSTKRLSALERIAEFRKPSYLKLEVLTAEKVFGWKNVHQHDGTLVGKKQKPDGGDKQKCRATRPTRCTLMRLKNA
jgi:hypothetical protein